MGISAKSREQYRILVIDDDAADYLSALGTIRNCMVLHLPDRLRACEFFFHNHVDLVILDHGTGQDCTKLLQFLKSVRPSIPVVTVTACGSESLAVSVFRNGARDYFKKPLEMPSFMASVGDALGIRTILKRADSERSRDGLFRAVGYINDHYDTQLKLCQVAREAGMSVSCFERLFKVKMGMTFTRYANQLRISKALAMLKESDLAISDIAFACGFTNQFHFARTFRKITKSSPSIVRRHQNGQVREKRQSS